MGKESGEREKKGRNAWRLTLRDEGKEGKGGRRLEEEGRVKEGRESGDRRC